MSDTNANIATLIDGDVLASAEDGIRSALKSVMPDRGKFSYQTITPRPTESQWAAFTAKAPVIGIGWHGWQADGRGSDTFRGTMVFTVAILTKAVKSDNLYRGGPTGPGAYGVTCAAIAVLNGLIISGVGTVFVVRADTAELSQFLSDGQASVLLQVEIRNAALDLERVASQLPQFTQIIQTDQQGDPLP